MLLSDDFERSLYIMVTFSEKFEGFSSSLLCSGNSQPTTRLFNFGSILLFSYEDPSK